MDLFSYLEALTYSKKDLTDHPDFEKTYDPFMINRFLSKQSDFVMYVSFVNQKIPKKAHYLYYLHFLPVDKKKRRFKFYKNKESKDVNKYIKIVRTYFDINEDRAKEILPFFDLKTIKKLESFTGGIVKKDKK